MPASESTIMVPPDPRFKCDSSANFATFLWFSQRDKRAKKKKKEKWSLQKDYKPLTTLAALILANPIWVSACRCGRGTLVTGSADELWSARVGFIRDFRANFAGKWLQRGHPGQTLICKPLKLVAIFFLLFCRRKKFTNELNRFGIKESLETTLGSSRKQHQTMAYGDDFRRILGSCCCFGWLIYGRV